MLNCKAAANSHFIADFILPWFQASDQASLKIGLRAKLSSKRFGKLLQQRKVLPARFELLRQIGCCCVLHVTLAPKYLNALGMFSCPYSCTMALDTIIIVIKLLLIGYTIICVATLYSGCGSFTCAVNSDKASPMLRQLSICAVMALFALERIASSSWCVTWLRRTIQE